MIEVQRSAVGNFLEEATGSHKQLGVSYVTAPRYSRKREKKKKEQLPTT
jgi:hypothetical protein